MISPSSVDSIESHSVDWHSPHYGKDPNGYLAYKDNPWFESCNRFCERYDQAAFTRPTPPSR